MTGSGPPRSPPAREPKPLKARAIGLLARREYSRAELCERLQATGAGRDACESVLDELAALGLLSDARFAQALVRQKQGGYARRAIAESLRQNGVASDVAAAALSDHAVDDVTALVALWRRRFGRPPGDEREKARQVRYLHRRGFSLAAILRLLRDPPADNAPGGA